MPKLLVAYGRYAATRAHQDIDVIYMGEGWNASVAVTRLPGGVLNYHNAGKVQASSEPQDMRLQRMLGHLTTLIPKSPKKVLVIGCGAGVTAGAVSIDPYLEHETIAEIEPLVPKVVSTYFAEHNFNVITNPKVHVQLDDARHYLMTTKEKFDAITSDPLDPVGQGRGDALHARVLRDRQVAPQPRRRRHALRAALREQHRRGEERDRDVHGGLPERRRLGQHAGRPRLRPRADGHGRAAADQRRRDRGEAEEPEYAPVAKSLGEVGMYSAIDLFANYAGRGPDLTAWTRDAFINRDRNLKLQYLAGLGLNLYQSDRIYSEMLVHAKYPEGLFTGSDATLRAAPRRHRPRAGSRDGAIVARRACFVAQAVGLLTRTPAG